MALQHTDTMLHNGVSFHFYSTSHYSLNDSSSSVLLSYHSLYLPSSNVRLYGDSCFSLLKICSPFALSSQGCVPILLKYNSTRLKSYVTFSLLMAPQCSLNDYGRFILSGNVLLNTPSPEMRLNRNCNMLQLQIRLSLLSTS